MKERLESIQQAYDLLARAQASEAPRDTRYIHSVGSLMLNCVTVATTALYEEILSKLPSNKRPVEFRTLTQWLAEIDVAGASNYVDSDAYCGLIRLSHSLDNSTNHDVVMVFPDTRLQDLAAGFDYLNDYLRSIFILGGAVFKPVANQVEREVAPSLDGDSEFAQAGHPDKTTHSLLFDCWDMKLAGQMFNLFQRKLNPTCRELPDFPIVAGVKKYQQLLWVAVRGEPIDSYESGMRFAENSDGRVAFIGVTPIDPRFGAPDETIVFERSNLVTPYRQGELETVVEHLFACGGVELYSEEDLDRFVMVSALWECQGDLSLLTKKLGIIRSWACLVAEGGKKDEAVDNIVRALIGEIQTPATKMNLTRLCFHLSMRDTLEFNGYKRRPSGGVLGALKRMILE